MATCTNMPDGRQEQARKVALSRLSWALGAWTSTRIESDKTVLALSTAGIGFLLVLMKEYKDTLQASLRGLLFLGALLFLAATILTLIVFRRNGFYVKLIANRLADEVVGGTPRLACALRKIPPQRYLADVLQRLADGWPEHRLR